MRIKVNTKEYFNNYTGDKGIQEIYTPVKELFACSNILQNELNLDNLKDDMKIAIVYSYEWMEYFIGEYDNLDRFNWTYFYDSEFDKKMFESLVRLAGIDKDRIDYFEINGKFPEFNETMKFDRIIMSPPYHKNIHLKAIAKTIPYLQNEGKCIDVSHARWLQKSFRDQKGKNIDYFRFENSVSKHIVDLELLKSSICNDIFGIIFNCDIGIYLLDNKENNFNYQDVWKNDLNSNEISIFNKISSFKQSLNKVIEKNKKDGIRVIIANVAGNRGALPIYKDIDYIINGKKNGLDWIKYKRNNKEKEKEEDMTCCSIKFNSETSAKNFYDSCKTGFYKFIANRFLLGFDFGYKFLPDFQPIPLFWLPWLGDVVNPRTGKKGYESEWTNEDFYKFFNITEEEQHLIEETMEKYK